MNAIAANYPTTFGNIPRWTVGTDPCTSLGTNVTGYLNAWVGVECDVYNATAETYYRVVAVFLRNYGLYTPRAGLLYGETLPPEFGQLPRLGTLDLSMNQLQGTIPNFVSPRIITM